MRSASAGRAAQRLAVLGGGPTGLACALLLAARGIEVEVIEARPLEAVRDDRRLLALSAGSLQVLAPLLDAGLPPHAPIERVHVSSRGELGTTLLSASRLALPAGTPLGVTTYYGALVAALDAAAAAQPLIALRRGRAVHALAQQPDAVRLTLDDGTTLRADGAIHAEGAVGGAAGSAGGGTSGTATARSDAAPVATPAGAAVLAPVTLAGPARGDAFERFTRDGPLALLPAPGPQPWSLVWCCAPARATALAALPAGAFTDALQEAVGPRLARVTAVGARYATPLLRAQRRTLHAHRCVWLGNAAQTLHPVAGQGYNLALRDAATLAAVLGAGRSPLPARLADYAARRRADRTTLGLLTGWLPELFATRALPVAYARAAGLVLLDALPPARRGLAQLLMFGVRP